MSAEAVIHAMLATTYERGARGPEQYDCWGMVCETCRRMGWRVPYDPLVCSDDLKGLLHIFRKHVRPGDWRACGPEDGAVAFSGGVSGAHHAGIVIACGILHTREGTGPEWAPVSDFDGQKLEFARWVG